MLLKENERSTCNIVMSAYVVLLKLENIAYLISVSSCFINKTLEWIVTIFGVWVYDKVVISI
jgi:hypothetical protein